jgi:predicted PurR-regulated permease PerM
LSTSLEKFNKPQDEGSLRYIFPRRLVNALTILAWVAIAGVIFWALGRITEALMLLSLAALVAYVIYPLVKLLERIMPRILAIILVYILILGILCGLLYVFVILAIAQINALIDFFKTLVPPQGQASPLQPIIDLFNRIGITKDEIVKSIQQTIAQLKEAVNDIVTLLTNFFAIIINLVLVATLSIYFLIDGERVSGWLHHKTPLLYRRYISFLVDTVARSVGGYIRGTITLNVLFAAMVGLGVGLLGVPYAFLLAMLTFFLAFIPVVGGYFIAALCILFALPQGWLITVIVAIFITVLQGLIIGPILGPRIVGKAVGLHPIVAIFAIIAGSELFGLLGALFAIPLAGVIQTTLMALWSGWQQIQPEQFPFEDDVVKQLDSSVEQPTT